MKTNKQGKPDWQGFFDDEDARVTDEVVRHARLYKK